MSGPSWPAPAAMSSSSRRHRRVRLPGGWPVPACWPMCWWPSTPIICPCIGRAASTHGKGWNWSARRWPTGSANATRCYAPWWRHSRPTCYQPASCMPTTPPYRYSPPAKDKPGPDGCGPMCGTTARRVTRRRRRSGSPTHRIGAANIPRATSKPSRAFCRSMPMPVSARSTQTARSGSRLLGLRAAQVLRSA